MSSMNHVDRFNALMDNQPIDRLPRVEWAPWWDQTIDRWRQEGLPPEANDPLAIAQYWGLDYYHRIRHATLDGAPVPADHGAGLMKDEADYEALKRHLYPPVRDDQLAEWKSWADRQDKGELLIWFTVEGFFWFPRVLWGIENHLYAFYDYPELMHRINQETTEYYLSVLTAMGRVCRPAYVTLAEDMSYNHGPMLSRELFDEFLAPYYRRLIPAIRETLGARVIVDSDGQVEAMIPWLESVGVDGIQPLERQAGVDGMAIRERHPSFGMIGHFDKMTLLRDESAIRSEFERLLPLMRAGRFIPSVDHQTPPGVSMDNYRIYRRLQDEYTLLACQ
jgi:hypothetical protein